MCICNILHKLPYTKFNILDMRIETQLALTSTALLTNILSAVTPLLNDTIVPPTSTVTQGKRTK